LNFSNQELEQSEDKRTKTMKVRTGRRNWTENLTEPN